VRLKPTTHRDVDANVQLTRHQLRTALRDHEALPSIASTFGDALLDAVCLRFALVPEVRWPMVDEAKARLLASGPPSADALAGMLVAGRRT
jgi:hypothetical protein